LLILVQIYKFSPNIALFNKKIVSLPAKLGNLVADAATM